MKVTQTTIHSMKNLLILKSDHLFCLRQFKPVRKLGIQLISDGAFMPVIMELFHYFTQKMYSFYS